ncbi:MAG: bifunctional UDP-sugar hydrolase/5'-nucleotidase [Myxococcota bacterium]
MRLRLSLPLLALLACDPPAAQAPAEPAASGTVTLSLVGTNDVHGHAERLRWLGGHLANLRAAREADGGGVVLVSAGDMWQGTLASNESEGAVMVRGFAALGYDAAAIGNHEFDYGPVGPRSAAERGDEPRGALLERAREARRLGVPFLAANMLEDGRPIAWPGVSPSVLFERAGRTIGVVGVSTEETTGTTLRANVQDLRMAPLAETIVREAGALRRRGAQVVVVAAHAGGRCDLTEDPRDLSSCEADSEIFDLARKLPPGLVDAIVAGHTHQAIAHEVNGIPILESHARGRAFGRVDLTVGPEGVVSHRIFPPRDVCGRERGPCAPEPYEGRPVVPDAEVAAAVAPELDAAETRLEASVGPRLRGRFRRSYGGESTLGRLLADMLLEASPEADLALLNGGGIRADLPAGPLRFGALYEAFPFDNRIARITLSGAQLEAVFRRHAGRSRSGLLVAGMSVTVRCGDRGPEVTLRDAEGRIVRDDARVVLVTSDYLASSGTLRNLGGPRPSSRVGEVLVRDAIAARLGRRRVLDPDDF